MKLDFTYLLLLQYPDLLLVVHEYIHCISKRIAL